MARVSKLTDVLTAMREAGGGKERLTGKWLELSTRHKGLHDALKAVFAKKPDTRRLGMWLHKNEGATHGTLTLVGRHSSHSKSWRYSIQTPGDLSDAAQRDAERLAKHQAESEAAHKRKLELAAAAKVGQAKTEFVKEQIKARMTARREAGRSDGFTTVANNATREVRAAVADALHSPPPEPLTTTRHLGNGRFQTETLIDPRTGEPVPEKAAAPKVAVQDDAPATVNVSPATAGDHRLQPWQREGRPPTVAEAAAAHTSLVAPYQSVDSMLSHDLSPWDGNGVGHFSHDGTRPTAPARGVMYLAGSYEQQFWKRDWL